MKGNNTRLRNKKNKKDNRNKNKESNHHNKAMNWMSSHRWSLKEWTPPWWATSHKPNKTYCIGYKRMKFIRPDSKTSSLRISTCICMINNMLGNLNKYILTNNKSNILILNLMRRLLLFILLLELCSININKINRRFIIVNINNIERRNNNKRLLINWRVYKRIKNKKNKNMKDKNNKKNNKKNNMKKNNKNKSNNSIWNNKNNKNNRSNKRNNLNKISLMNSPRWESRKWTTPWSVMTPLKKGVNLTIKNKPIS